MGLRKLVSFSSKVRASWHVLNNLSILSFRKRVKNQFLNFATLFDSIDETKRKFNSTWQEMIKKLVSASGWENLESNGSLDELEVSWRLVHNSQSVRKVILECDSVWFGIRALRNKFNRTITFNLHNDEPENNEVNNEVNDEIVYYMFTTVSER